MYIVQIRSNNNECTKQTSCMKYEIPKQIITPVTPSLQIIITWYAAHPVSQLIVLFMAEYNRLKVFVAISQFLRGCALAQLANLFIRRSLFWEVSSLSATSLPFAERTFARKNEEKDQMSGFSYQGYDKLTKRN